jgi:hypothetical protein
LGGRTGRAGAIIFFTASALSAWATTINPNWQGTAYAMLMVDVLCLFALIGLALLSSRYWPIWALGLQSVSVATHVATMIDANIMPGIYDSMSGFWSIPILTIMVAGTMLDRSAKRKESNIS